MRQLINEYLGMTEPDDVKHFKSGNEKSHSYVFDHAGHEVEVAIYHDEMGRGDVDFLLDKRYNKQGQLDQKDIPALYGKVMHVITQHADKYNIKRLHFSGGSPKKQQLYAHMAKRLANKHGWRDTTQHPSFVTIARE